MGSRGARPSARSRAAADERGEQRVRTVGPALELGVGLRGDEERMQRGRELDELDEPVVGRGARADQARLLEAAAVLGCSPRSGAGGARRRPPRRRRAWTIDPARSRAGYAPRRIVPPRSTTSRCSSMRSITGCGVCGSNSLEFAPASPQHVARELDDRAVQPEAQPEERDAVLARVARGGDLALDAADPEPTGDDDAVEIAAAGPRRAAPRRRRPRSSRSRPVAPQA